MMRTDSLKRKNSKQKQAEIQFGNYKVTFCETENEVARLKGRDCELDEIKINHKLRHGLRFMRQIITAPYLSVSQVSDWLTSFHLLEI